MDGVLALMEDDSNVVECSDIIRCQHRTQPASTFKIVTTLVALETSVATDETFSLPWDGIVRSVPEWNQTLSLQQAFDVSAVPYFQELARNIGLERFRRALETFHYGNSQVGTVVDRFWLDGPLAVSPVEQIDFLGDLESGRLPVSPRTRELTRAIMIRQSRNGAVLRGKTGWVVPSLHGSSEEYGWFVGYATRAQRVTYVAVRIRRNGGMSEAQFLAARVAVAIRALEARDAY